MIYHKIFVLQQELKTHIKQDRKREKALSNIKKLLMKVDNNAEVVPASNIKKLSLLLSFLKEKPLSRYEKIVIGEIINN